LEKIHRTVSVSHTTNAKFHHSSFFCYKFSQNFVKMKDERHWYCSRCCCSSSHWSSRWTRSHCCCWSC